MKESIINKFTIPFEDQEIKITEEEMLYILEDWFSTHFNAKTESIRTHSYFEEDKISHLPMYIRHGVKLRIKQ